MVMNIVFLLLGLSGGVFMTLLAFKQEMKKKQPGSLKLCSECECFHSFNKDVDSM